MLKVDVLDRAYGIIFLGGSEIKKDTFNRYYVFMSKSDQFCIAGHDGDKSSEYEIINTYIGSDAIFKAELRAEEYNLEQGFIDILAYTQKEKDRIFFIKAITKEGKLITKNEYIEAIKNPDIKVITINY